MSTVAVGRVAAAATLLALAGGCDDANAPGQDGSAGSDATASGPDQITVATWNAQDLFDDRDDPAKNDEVLSSAAYDTKLERVARVLRALDADVVALQEVENEGVLDTLADEHLSGQGYDERVLTESFDPRGIDVGFLSRLPVEGVASHLEDRFRSPDGTETYRFARDALELFVRVSGEVVVVATVHLISMRSAESDERRLAEATQLRRIVDRRMETGVSNIVVAGDFNDLPQSATLAAMTEDGGLTDLVERVPSNDRWTFNFRGDRRVLDYVLATDDMAGAAVVDVRILHGTEVDSASDHQPVVATFDLTR